ALDDEKEAEEDLEAKDSSLEMQSFPKPWGELTEGAAPVVSIMTENKEWYAQDGETVLYEAFQDTVTVENEGFENLQAALAEYFLPIDEKEHEGLLQYAQEAYDDFEKENDNDSQRSFYTHSCWQNAELMRSDSTVVSFEEYMNAYLGRYAGAVYAGATFDVQNGRKLKLTDILQDEEGFYKAAVDYIMDWLTEFYRRDMQSIRDYVESAFSEEQTDNWYLNGAGIVIIYNDMTPGPGSAVKITLPYGLFYEYIREEYTNPHTELIAAVPEGEDIAGLLGMEQLVEITSDGPGDGFVYVTIDDMSERAGVGRFGDAYVIRRQNGRSFFAFVVLEEDVDTMCVYEITGGEIKKCDEKTEAYFDSSFWGTERIGISLTVHALGTHTGYMDFKWDEEGKLVAAEDVYEVKAAWNLIVIKDIPVRIKGMETVVKAGEQIMVTGINMEENIYYFQVVDSGEYGEIYYNETQKGRMIDGISEFEYFENLNYAG
ncbi:MAG: hypothetical protein K2N82_08450, partial [Lachnospiraceae bacterium]|nr:hypothetical protein [Lachnospiraceae bacterium]